MKTITTTLSKITPNWQVRPVLLFMLLLGFLLMASCGKDDTGTNEPIEDPNSEDPESELTFAQVVANSADFDFFAESTTKTESSETTVTKEDYSKVIGGSEVEQRWVCTETEVDVLGGSADFPLYNPTSSVIWPGNLLEGKTLNNTLPKAITVNRGLGQITYNVVDGNNKVTSNPVVITEGSVNQAMNTIIDGNTEFASNFVLDVKRINSKSQLAFELGLSVETLTTKVDGKFSYNSSTEVNSVLVELKEEYYTMSFVTPTSVEAFFDPSLTAEELQTKIGPDNPVAFIKSVTFGRIFYLLYESTSSAEEMEAALKGEYDGLVANGQTETKLDVYNEFNDVTVKVIAFGGNSEATLGASAGIINGLEDLSKIVESLSKAGTKGSGKALSYEVYSLKDPDQRLSSNLATKYTVKKCEFKGTKAPQNYKELVDIFEYGIGAATKLTGSKFLVYNKAGDKYALYDLSAGKKGTRIDNVSEGPFRLPASFGPVGAALLYRANEIHFFDKEGKNFIIANSITSSFGNDLAQCDLPFLSCRNRMTGNLGAVVELTSDYYSDESRSRNSFPFAGDGIVAALAKETLERTIVFNQVEEYNQDYFSNEGSNATSYKSYPPAFSYLGEWGSSEATTTFMGSPSFNKVGAAVKISYGGNTINYLYFNQAGDEMIIKGNPTFTGPYIVN